MEAIVSIAVLIGVGFLCRRRKVADASVIAGLKNLVTHVFLPVLVFDTLANAQFGKDSLVLLGCSAAAHLILFAVARGLRRRICEFPEIYPYMVECFECGMIGYALFVPLVGQDNLAPVATMDMASALFGFTILTNGLTIATGGKREHSAVYEMFRTPTFLALLFGVAAGLLGFGTWIGETPFADVYAQLTDYLTAPLTPLILLCIGFDLQFEKKMMAEILKVMASRLMLCLLFLAATWFVCTKTIGMTATLQKTLILYFMLPPGFLTPIYVTEGRAARFVSGFLSIYIVFTLLVFAALSL